MRDPAGAVRIVNIVEVARKRYRSHEGLTKIPFGLVILSASFIFKLKRRYRADNS